MKSIYLPAGAEYVQFGEIAHQIANALCPLSDDATDSEMMAYGGARINLEAELKQAVKAGTLPVKDPLTFGPHTFPVGDALRRSLVSVSDLRAFLDGRPISLESAPARNAPREPGLFTLEEAAQAIATNLGWHDGARDTLKNQLMQAARDGLLTVRHPHTDAPYRPDTVRDFYELVTPADVNEWAARGGVSWRWELPTPEPKAAPVVTEVTSVVTHSTKARRDTLTPVIELAQRQCRNPKDTAEVWAALLVLAEKKSAPLIGATEEGLQYLNNGSADIFKRDSLRKRLSR